MLHPAMLNLRLRRIRCHRERFLPLLLQADESEAMIARYLERCELYGLFVDRRVPVALACITDETAAFAPGGAERGLASELADQSVCECRNLVTAPEFRGRGCGRQLLMRLCGIYDADYAYMIVGTGDVPGLRRFYEQSGFRERYVRKGFFSVNYAQPIVGDGRVLEDMVVFGRRIKRDDPDPMPWGAFMGRSLKPHV